MNAAMRLLACLLLACSIGRAQGSLLLVGGGSEDRNDWSDRPYRWLVDHAPNRRILVLNYEDTTSFFSSYLPWLSPCTVENRAITSVTAANDSVLYRFILGFDGIFLRGGDQWQYVTRWRGTLTEQAIREVFARGGVVGGTSAGEAVLSEVIFDARETSVAPRTALRNPFAAGVTLTTDFLGFAANMIADSHFFERGRLGRLPAFVAFAKQKTGREIIGVGIEYGTALAIGTDGIGEVMGSGTVTVVRSDAGTTTELAQGAPLSMHGLRFDQLTDGARFDIHDGTTVPAPDAFPYDAVRYTAPASPVLLDGGSTIGEWTRSGGSLARCRSLRGSTADTMGVITSASGAGTALIIVDTLAGWSVPAKRFVIAAAVKDDPVFAGSLGSCGGLVFVGNVPDSLAALLDPSTLAGQACRSVMQRGSPLLFLSDDVMLAGDQGIGQMYKSIYGAYYGYLTSVRGLGVLRGVSAVPRLYESSDLIDNRASGLFWSMVRGHCPLGLLLDNGSYAVINGSTIAAYGLTPMMVIDAHAATSGSVPSFKDPGKPTPRQLGGIVNGTFSVVRDGEVYTIDPGTDVAFPDRGSARPAVLVLQPNYPNPFNPSTTVRYAVPARGHVSVSVHNALGQVVALLVDEDVDPGEHTCVFTPRGLASGVYWCTVRFGPESRSRAMILVR